MQPPPTRIGAWEVVRPLGAGGMGSVWLVEHAETRARRALKLVRPGPGRDLARARREVEALSRVDGHPNVVRVHDCGELSEPAALWLVMDLAEGGDLAARLARGPLPISEVVSLGRALARGLEHVHSRGVLHRDLKPANVLFDERGAPRLVDFGVARVDDAARLTRSNDLVGTPQYLAPEALVGAGALDARADVWGLGVVLYEALTGVPPVDASDFMEYVARVGRGQVVPPSRRRGDVPRGLEAVVLRALAPDRDRRFPSAQALGDALDALDAEGRAPRSARLGAGLAALGLVVAALVAAALGRGERPSPPAPGPAGVGATEPAPSSASLSLTPAAVAAALAREEHGPVLAALEARRAEVVAARCPPDHRAALAGALLVGEDRAALARWRDACGSSEVRATLDGIDGLLAADPQTRSPSPAPLPGYEGVAQRLRAARMAPLASGPSPPGPLLDALEAALDAAGTRLGDGPLEAALRVELQRLVLSRDTSLVHTARRPSSDRGAQPERLVARTLGLSRAGPARIALQVLASWIAARRPGEGGRDPRRDAPSDAEVDALPARYDALRFVHLSRRFAIPAEPAELADPVAIEAQLARWPATFELARRLALLGDDGRPTEVAILEETPRVGLAVDACAGRGDLVGRRAWFARAGPDARARLDEALAAAAQVQRSKLDLGLLLEARLHLQAGDPASARAALGRAPGEGDVRLGLRGELALLEGEVDEAGLAAGQLAMSTDELFGDALRTWGASLGAAISAARGNQVPAEERLRKARELEATRPRAPVLTCPWRTTDETARQVEAARSGWRPWLAGRPWAP